ncbi:flagellinolysin [Tepidibacter hydrothermalis]|uniref:Flagellin n=1 Tax=Tepidibacter hydrothermalis TaxID=3036126 RepID=A0ABY8EH04_9FIRM|nr:flagellinolysin [Tepidibacter hydrothermalis]WFD10048.1 flagellinolysin [Tepidibacter hydrothermalis]
MIISHNINAINSHRTMHQNILTQKKSIEKLSSGLRINRAGDDAAGLAISEKMKSQVRGLNQGSRNIQDGISLIQTADGGLSEIHSLLHRGRELSVQSSNDTLTKDDRNAIQQEINQIKEEVDKISQNTHFNGKKLLNNFVSPGLSKENNVINGLKDGWLEEAEKIIKDVYGLEGTGTNNLHIILEDDAPYGSLAYVGGTVTDLELHIDLADFDPATGESGDTILGKGFYADRIIAHEMTHAVMNDSFGAAKMNDFHTNNAVWFVEGTAEFIPGSDERLKNVIGNAGQTGIDNTKLDSLINRAKDLLNGAAWSGDDTDYSAGYVISKFLDTQLQGNGSDFSALMTAIKSGGATATATLKTEIGNLTGLGSYANFVTEFSKAGAGGANDYIQNTITLDWGADEVDTGSIKGSDHSGLDLNAEKVIDESSSTSKEQPLSKFNVIWPSVKEPEPLLDPLKIQSGANAGDFIEIDLVGVTSEALDIHDIDVIDESSSSIEKFDKAIKTVSMSRGKFGALQNRLEHSLAVTFNTSENLTASESRIRDVDMAKEMMKYSKTNILQQASQAMLSQAKQQPQAVLQLLR